MWNKQCINYNENDLVNFTSSTERIISVLPIPQPPYVIVRQTKDSWLWAETYYSNKYKFKTPVKDWEICGPLVTLIIELATKHQFK